MSPSPNLKLKAENFPLEWLTFMCLSAHNASAKAEIILKKAQKSILKFIETLKRYYVYINSWVLYMYTCLSQILWRKKCLSTYILTLSLFLCFQTRSNKKGKTLKTTEVYIFTYNKLRLLINFLCSTANNVTLRTMLMEQTGTLLDGKKLTNHRVSSV